MEFHINLVTMVTFPMKMVRYPKIFIISGRYAFEDLHSALQCPPLPHRSDWIGRCVGKGDQQPNPEQNSRDLQGPVGYWKIKERNDSNDSSKLNKPFSLFDSCDYKAHPLA